MQNIVRTSRQSSDGASEAFADLVGDSWVTMRRKPFDRETRDQCKKWQRQSIGVLSKGGRAAQRLASKLRTCTRDKPCASEACAHCMYDFRSRLLEQSVSVMPVGGSANTIITSGLKFGIGDLCACDVKKEVRRLRKRIARSGLLKNCLILGGLDVSLEFPLHGPPFWQVHLYVLIDHRKSKQLKTAIMSAFPAEPVSEKPYFCRELVDRLEPVGYAYKMRFDTHHSYINEDTGALNKDTQRNFIPDEHRPELLLFLDSFPIGSRMLLRGIRRHGRRLNLKVIRKFAISPEYGRRSSR